MDLRGRKAIITGGAGFIGKAIADTLAEMGADLCLVDRPGCEFETIKEDLEEKWGVTVGHYPCDLESQEQRVELVSQIEAIDLLVNNAAFVGDSKLTGWAESFDGQSTETWRRALEVNLTAVFELSRELAPQLSASGKGVIINIGSIYGVSAPDYSLYANTKMANPAAYCASKAGLLQLTKWLSTTLAPKVRVNAISPGGVWRGQPKEFVDRYNTRTPLGRMACEEDFKGAVAYLASDLSAYVTGQNLLVDGGWTSW